MNIGKEEIIDIDHSDDEQTISVTSSKISQLTFNAPVTKAEQKEVNTTSKLRRQLSKYPTEDINIAMISKAQHRIAEITKRFSSRMSVSHSTSRQQSEFRRVTI